MCASHKPPRCRERDVPCPLCDKNAECMCDVSVCVLHAGRPSTAKQNIRCAHGNAIPQEDGWPFGGACVQAHLRGHVHGPRAPAWACARRRCVRRRSIDARGAPQRKKRKQGRRRTKAPTLRHEARVAPRQTGRRGRRRCTQEESNGVPPAAVRVPEPHFVLFAPECRWRALRWAHTVARQPSPRTL